MLRSATAIIVATAILSGCGAIQHKAPSQTAQERAAQIQAAAGAIKAGHYQHAESLLADYMYRDDDGDLRFKFIRFTSDGKKQAIDTVAMLLWETGRDKTLVDFAKRYLTGDERQTMLCRVAERNAEYEDAYHCWNDMGDIDRARRTIRTESALRILRN